MNFLTEYGICSYKELAEQHDAIATESIRIMVNLQGMEQLITNLITLSKQIDASQRLNPTYDRYKA